MKIKISKSDWLKLGKESGFIKEARRKDSHGISLGYAEKYILRKKVHGMDDPYFLGGGNFHNPDLVFMTSEAAQIAGDKLENSSYDWTKDWEAVPVNTPSPEFLGLNKPKTASQIPNTQNQNPDENNFAVDLIGKIRSVPGAIKSRINKEIHSLGNYFQEIPLEQIISILKKYNVILLQEDGTIWSGFVTSQGECGSDQATKQGPMKFELAVKTEQGYSITNHVLLMTVCEMPSGKLEVIAYVS